MALNNGFQRWAETLREVDILGGIHLDLGNQERNRRGNTTFFVQTPFITLFFRTDRAFPKGVWRKAFGKVPLKCCSPSAQKNTYGGNKKRRRHVAFHVETHQTPLMFIDYQIRESGSLFAVKNCREV